MTYNITMATEEFKALTKELFNNYIGLHEHMEGKAGKPITLSFREYIDFYLRYIEEGTYESDQDNYEDEVSPEDDEE